MRSYILTIFLTAISLVLLRAQTFCLQFVEVLNTNTEYVVALQIAGSSDFLLGSSNLEFTYNDVGLDNPQLESSPLSALPAYQNPRVTRPASGFCSFNIELLTPNTGTMVTTNFTTIGEIRFDIIDGTQTGALFWSYDGGTTKTVVFDHNESTQLLATDPTCLVGLDQLLPVELLSFSTTAREKDIQLDWRSAQEIAFAGYQIERSTDGRGFSPLHWQPAEGGAFETSYRYLDTEVQPGIDYYYRLQLRDLDGRFEYSPIRQALLMADHSPDIQVYPNPASNKISLSWWADQVGVGKLKLYNGLGQLVQQRQISIDDIGPQQLDLNVNLLPAGLYQLQLEQNGQSFVRSLVLE